MQREVCFVIAWMEKEIYNPNSLRNHLTPSFWRIWTAQQTIIVSHVTHQYGLTSWVLKSKRNNMTTEHENGKESVLSWILFSVFANLELLLLVHWRPISHISYKFKLFGPEFERQLSSFGPQFDNFEAKLSHSIMIATYNQDRLTTIWKMKCFNSTMKVNTNSLVAQ